MADKVRIELEIDETGAIRSIGAVDSEMGELRNTTGDAESQINRTRNALEVAFGVAIQRLIEGVINRIKQLSGEMFELMQNIQDTDSEFESVFRNNRQRADGFINKFRDMTGFTTTESRKMASEIAGIAMSLGETEEQALAVTEASAELALQWERIAGMKFEEGYRAIALALTGNVAEMQRAGIISRELTRTQFYQMTMQERLQVVTDGLTARYGNLSEATDGLTQQSRRLQGHLHELRDQVLRDLRRSFEAVAGAVNDVMDNSRGLSREVSVNLMAQLSALNSLVETLSRTISGGSESMGVFGIVLQQINQWLNTLNIQTGNTIMGIVAMLREMPPQLRVVAAAFGLTEERLKEFEETAISLISVGADFNDILRASRLLTEQASHANVNAIEKLVGEWEAVDNLDAARTKLLETLKEELRLRRELLSQGGPEFEPSDAGDFIADLTRRFDELGDDVDGTFKGISDSIYENLSIVNRSADEFMEVFRRAGDTGRFSITGINFAIKELQKDMEETFDEGERNKLLAYIAELEKMREAALGVGDAIDDTNDKMKEWSHFIQATMANTLSNTIIQFTSVFEEIGRGSDKMAQTVLKSLLMIVRGLGQQLIAWGTSQILMSSFGPISGAAAIAYGTLLAGLSSLGIGSMSKGSSVGGASPVGLSSVQPAPMSNAGLSTNDIAAAMSNVKWSGTLTTDFSRLVVEFENYNRKRNDTA
jgi:hypothetical protein